MEGKGRDPHEKSWLRAWHVSCAVQYINVCIHFVNLLTALKFYANTVFEVFYNNDFNLS